MADRRPDPSLAGVPIGRYTTFQAAGFDRPVCGIVYDQESTVVSGMPLGGIDTGCVDIETTGMLGYRTIFNSHVPRGGPVNEPFLGIAAGGTTWILSTGKAKAYEEPRVAFARAGEELPSATRSELADVDFSPARTSSGIRYWGHYPVADMEFINDAPVEVSVRAFSPFIPGDLDASVMPGAVFSVRITNTSGSAQEGELIFSFSGPTAAEAGRGVAVREPLAGGLAGQVVRCSECEYAVGVVAPAAGVRVGAGLGTDGTAWAQAATGRLRAAAPGDGGSGVAVMAGFRLEPGQSMVRTFVLSWWSPSWWGEGSPAGGGNRYRHRYASAWPGAAEVATALAGRWEVLLGRVLAWQSVVYESTDLPIWLRSALVNVLHLLTEDGLWATAEDVGAWCRPEDGLFGMIESPRSCAQIECIPCSFYGAIPLPYFFPSIARSTLRGYKHYQYPNGEVPWVFGGITAASPLGRQNCCEMIYPAPGYQTSLNGVCYVSLVDRYWRCTGDRTFLAEFYDSVRSAVRFTLSLRPEYEEAGLRVLAMPAGDVGTEWFEAPEPGWFGITSHVGGLHLAMLALAERMAREVGDEAFASECRASLAAGQDVMERALWAGTHYLSCRDPDSGTESRLIFGYQLDGEWLARSHGMPGVFDQDRVQTTLSTIWRGNVALTSYGAVNYTEPDGSAADVGGYGPYSMFPPEVLMLAMTYMYAGETGKGEEIARRCWENIECQQGLTWDQPNVFRGDADTGERTFGADYYQNMMLWALPAALGGEELGAAAQPGGLVARMLWAGAAARPSEDRTPAGLAGSQTGSR